MVRFSYAAVMETGQRVTGTLRSRNRHDALKQLMTRGCHPVTLRPVEEGVRDVRRMLWDAVHRVSLSDLAVFTRQLASLLKAGLPVLQALMTLRRQSATPRLARVIQDIEETLSREAGTLAEALDDHPKVFDAVYRGLVRAGEEGGNLVEVLNNLARHLSQSARLRGQVLGAFIYPIFLLVLGSGAIFVLTTFVIPRFQELFESFGQELPLPTRMLIAVSSFMASWWWAVLVGLLTGALLLVLWLRKPAFRERFDRRMLRLPVLGSMFMKLEISRISRTLAALLAGGVRILDALRITADTARNLAVKATFAAMIKGVAGGETLATVFEKARLFPPLMVSLIRTGEDTGELPEMLGELSVIYEDETERAVTGAVKLLEPMLIVVMGGIIAGVVASVMLPIFQANAMVK